MDKQTLQLKVEFVEFGNIAIVEFFQCKDLPSQFLYPAPTIPAKLGNAKPSLKGEDAGLLQEI